MWLQPNKLNVGGIKYFKNRNGDLIWAEALVRFDTEDYYLIETESKRNSLGGDGDNTKHPIIFMEPTCPRPPFREGMKGWTWYIASHFDQPIMNNKEAKVLLKR